MLFNGFFFCLKIVYCECKKRNKRNEGETPRKTTSSFTCEKHFSLQKSGSLFICAVFLFVLGPISTTMTTNLTIFLHSWGFYCGFTFCMPKKRSFATIVIVRFHSIRNEWVEFGEAAHSVCRVLKLRLQINLWPNCFLYDAIRVLHCLDAPLN